MKSIFKKIALVLALAMVVTMLPAKSVSVSAADNLASSWVRKSAMLYIGTVTGDKDDIYLSAVYATKKAAVKKDAPNGWETLGYSVSFKSDDETVATVGARYGLIEAVGVGQTTITATFSKDGEEDLVATFPVTVKGQAEQVALTDESQEALGALTVGGEVTLTARLVDADGNEDVAETMHDEGGKLSELFSEGRKFVTDFVKLVVENPEDKEVLKVEGNKVTAVAEGDAKLTVKAYRYDWQSWGQTKSQYVKVVTAPVAMYTVTVKNPVPTVTNAMVVSTSKIVLDVTGVTDEDVKNLKITNKDDISQNIYFKEEKKLNEEKTQITLERYTGSALQNGDVLNFFFGEEKDNAFILDVKIGEIAGIRVDGPTTVPKYGYAAKKLDVHCVDENGVDLEIPVSNLTFDYVDGSRNYQVIEEEIFVYEDTGAKVVLKATYTVTKQNDKQEWIAVPISSDPFTIEVVEPDDITVKDIQWNVEDKDYGTNEVTAYVGNSLKLYVKGKLSDDTEFVNGDINLSFETSRPEIVLVDASTGDLTPMKEGNALILIKYDNNDKAQKTVGVPVTVKAEKKLTSVAPDKAMVVISNAVGIESATIEFTGKDQYGVKFDNTSITKVELAGATKDDVVGWANEYSDGRNTLTVTGAGQKAGTYTYRVYVSDTISTVVNVMIKQPKESDVTKATSYKVVPVTNDVEINPIDAANAKYEFQIVALDASGVAFGILGSDQTSVLAVKVGNTVCTPMFEDGKYTVKLAEIKGAGTIVSPSAITVSGSAIDKETNVIAKGVQYKVEEGTVSISTNNKKINGHALQPFTSGKVTVKKVGQSIKVASIFVESGTGREAVEASIIDQLSLDSKDGSTFEVIAIAAKNSDLKYAGRTSIVFVENVRVAEIREDGSVVMQTIALNQSFQVTTVD